MASLFGGQKKKLLWGTCIGIYAGQYYDSETGLHYNYHRYYDPKLGRYLRTDPMSVSNSIVELKTKIRNLNKRAKQIAFDNYLLSVLLYPEKITSYGYAINNPLLFFDMYGLSEEDVEYWQGKFDEYKDLLEECGGDMSDYDNCRKCCKAIAHIGLEGDANAWWMPFEVCHASMCEDCL